MASIPWPWPSRGQHRLKSAFAMDVHSTSAAIDKTCTVPDSRAWCKARHTDAAEKARYSGGHPDHADIHPSHVAGHRDSQSVVDRRCARPSHSCGKKFREFLTARMARSCTTPIDHRLRISIDRKSTRLNSSHANISYAVFSSQK